MAIAEDASAPAAVTSTTTAVTTASFTPAANSLLVAVATCGNNTGSGTVTAPVTDSLSSSWTLLKRGNGSTGGSTEIWAMDAGASPAARTVTVTGTGGANAVGVALCVKVLTGAKPVASVLGASGTLHATTAYSIALTSTTTGSLVCGGLVDVITAGALTVNGITTAWQSVSDTSDTEKYGAWRATSLTGTPGAQTYGYSNTAANNQDIVAVELLAATAATAPLPSDVPRRVRRFPFPRRRTSSTAIFPQIVITPHPVPPQPPRRLLPIAWRPKAKPRFAQPPTGPKFNGSYPVPPQPVRDRLLLPARRRQTSTQPVPAQVIVVTAQALPPQPQRRRTIPTFRRGRARSTTVITVQAALPPQPTRDRLAPPLRRRPTATAVVTVRVQQPPQPARDRLIPFPRRRTASAQPPLSTVVTVTAQALPPQPGRPARAAWLPRSKARQAQPVPAQQAIVLHPAPPQPGRPVRAPWLPRAKARRAEPVWPQQVVVLHPAPPQPARDRLLPPLLRRSRNAQPVSTQIVVTAQALPPQPIRRRRPWWLPRSRAKRYEPSWPQGAQSAVFTIGTLTTGDQGTGVATASAAAVTVTVTTDKPSATQSTNTQRTGGPS